MKFRRGSSFLILSSKLVLPYSKTSLIIFSKDTCKGGGGVTGGGGGKQGLILIKMPLKLLKLNWKERHLDLILLSISMFSCSQGEGSPVWPFDCKNQRTSL